MTTSSPGRRNELGPMALDGVLKGNTSGPFYSMASNYDVSCPCPCISDEADLKRQCDKHKSKTENLIDKIEYKVTELERLKAYTDRFGKILDRIRIEDIETLIRYTESEDEMETDLGTRQYFHCNKEECVHRSSFDLYLQYKTAKWELKCYCSLVRKHHDCIKFHLLILMKIYYHYFLRSIENTTVLKSGRFPYSINCVRKKNHLIGIV
jgi:hypothetical protein